ncbi:MAG TPA: SURF1 family protein [Woeseiaceae bacterium]|nr:SURF1 family protein [Woeseiaceae bacterium]
MTLGNLAPRDLLPPLAGIALVVLFVNLGVWQLERAEEKRAIEAAFSDSGEGAVVNDIAGERGGKVGDGEVRLYQPLSASGRYLADRQFLIDNMILEGRVGYFVVTPFEWSRDEPLLLVNRGWLQKSAAAMPSAIGMDASAAETITGRAGRLPRVGVRAGDVFTGGPEWPRIANWPTLDELAAALGRDVLPFILLADPEPGSNLVRHWEPRQAGPMRHIGYAVQWFALALAVIATAFVVYRKKREER